MLNVTPRQRRKPGIGPRGLFSFLAAGVALFLVGSRIWPSVPHEVRNAIRTVALTAFWIFFCVNLIVFFKCWRRG
jgi:hypothetical protein